jgi:hypothetical protein
MGKHAMYCDLDLDLGVIGKVPVRLDLASAAVPRGWEVARISVRKNGRALPAHDLESLIELVDFDLEEHVAPEVVSRLVAMLTRPGAAK